VILSRRYTLPEMLLESPGSSPTRVVLQGTLETSWGNTTTLASTGEGLESSHTPTQARLATVTPAGRESSMSADEKPEEKEEEGL